VICLNYDAAIVRRHILPNILSPLIVVATTQVAGATMAEAALSFLGLGLPVTQPSLGTLIRSGYDLIFAGITVLLGLTLVSMLVAVNVLGDTPPRRARPAPCPTLTGGGPNPVDNKVDRLHDGWDRTPDLAWPGTFSFGSVLAHEI
jgi:Binding-protein-dependent transport system inner membrane component